jgi:hypothetical protein
MIGGAVLLVWLLAAYGFGAADRVAYERPSLLANTMP